MSTSIPPVLSSAQTVISAGFSRLGTAAAKIAQGKDRNESPGSDPLVDGVVGMVQARGEVRAGVALVDTYQRMSDDLAQMAEPTGEERREGRGQYVDVYG